MRLKIPGYYMLIYFILSHNYEIKRQIMRKGSKMRLKSWNFDKILKLLHKKSNLWH